MRQERGTDRAACAAEGTQAASVRLWLRLLACFALPAFVVSSLLAPPRTARAQDLLLPEWHYEPAATHGVLQRAAGRSAEASWALLDDSLSDGWSITKSPLSWRWRGWLAVAAVGGATTGLVFLADDPLRDAARGSDSFERFGHGIRFLGTGPGLAAVVGGFAATGILLDRPKDRETAKLLLEASAVGYVFNLGGKYTLGRSRPRTSRGPRAFEPFSGHFSMPSGETTGAFLMAGVLTAQYPSWPVQIAAYSLAAAVGAGRIALDAHWGSDVFVSAALGIVVSKAVVHLNRRRVEEREQARQRVHIHNRVAAAPRRVCAHQFLRVSPRALSWTVVF